MASFDPAAATAAYLAELPPEVHERASAYTHGGHWLLLGSAAIAVVSAWLILRSQILVRAKLAIEKRKPRPWLAAFVLGLLFFTLDFVIQLPWLSYSAWFREKSFGLTSQPWSGWLVDTLIATAVTLPALGLMTMVAYALIRRSRTWPFWIGTMVALVFLFANFAWPVVVEPLVNTYQSAPPGPVREAVVALGEANGVPTDRIFIFNGSKQSSRYTANVAGMFGTARIALSDTMFAKGADLAEIRAVVGHEMGHYVRVDILRQAAGAGLLLAVAGFLVQLFFPRLIAALKAPNVEGATDPAGLPIVMMIVSVLGLLSTPAFATLTRTGEAAADAFSLAHAREPDGLARAMVKTVEYRAATPSDLEEFLFYDHPSVSRRIRRAMDWKAANPRPAPSPAPPRPRSSR